MIIEPGSTVTVEWQETIDHPGRFKFNFSPAGDSNWQMLKTVTDTQNNNVLPHQYTTTITFPNVQCMECTLQMIQVMTKNPAAPSYYYSCADIQLRAQSQAPAPAPADSEPTPGSPGNNCKP